MYRILYIEEGPFIGGSTHTLLHLTSGLDRSRFEPVVLFRYPLPIRERFASRAVATATWESIGGQPPPPPVPFAGPVPSIKASPPYRLLHSVKRYALRQRPDAGLLEEWMRRERFSLLHANNAVSENLAAIVAAGKAGIPAVSHQRGFFRLTALHRLLSRRVERFLCVSEAVRRHYVAQGLAPGRVTTVYDGVDLERYAPAPRSVSDRPLVGWFARFERWKGCIVFAEAARALLARDPRARVIMAGAGPEEDAVRRIVDADPACRDRFDLPGFRGDAAEIMARCDVVVNSSIEPEPCSNTALEALALGLPVVASDAGGNPEIVEHGVNGFVVPAGDARAMADALERLCADPALRSRFGEAGRARALALFDARRYAATVQELYGDLLSGRA